jgi:MSHA pilin protein MshC
MTTPERGFTLIELVAVIILVGILSITLFSRFGSAATAPIQSGRDDLIAALFFAQQQAMMRSNISLVLTANSVSVNENGNPIRVSNDFYPLTMPSGVVLPALTLSYDKLGRIPAATQIVVTGSGNSSGVTATIQVDASGYAYAQ